MKHLYHGCVIYLRVDRSFVKTGIGMCTNTNASECAFEC